ncbi:GNAT family N-acetyltransferase [Nocardioides limicola]|uniref:GNAT family N-acetyltransferase n=1 Tax=Nocardioides limicola TaxID=2803368 RepID=UPI0027DD742A|nr:GNAT family N-acetyltransferase [Nocardioides sp. DJM-14]
MTVTPLIRPMVPDDVTAAEDLSGEAFGDHRPVARATAWIARTEHLLRTDPGGCWVAEQDQRLLGFATSLVRETTWILASYAVLPTAQGQGLGRGLLEAALQHGRACLHGMLCASDDPRALRRYRAAGFDLHPQMRLSGRLDRSSIPPLDKVREGVEADLDLMDSVDRGVRGAGHGVDHHLLTRQLPLLVSDTSTGSGYVYVDPAAGPRLLAATNRRTATRLLWAGLALCQDQVLIENVSSANQWALDVGLTARLELGHQGYLAVRGVRPPTPYLPHGSFL